ncbi:response regulator transcription factor [Pseudonocardia lacus]|uniref:response regulator transcription factor n=1 Tax=Pseudonocardia lacus TaxID=2835865 RepID=UPI001BDCA780|nr:response regulator transcription factor [Pseudonocardia lacus]
MGDCRLLLVAGASDGAAGGAVAALTSAGLEPERRATTPDEAAAAVVADPPDLVVVALAAGPAAVAAVVEAGPEVPVLVLVGQVEPDAERHAAVLAAVGAGATSVVLEPGELADAALRTVAGAAVFSPGLAELVLQSVSSPDADAAARLTDRESDVLRLIVDGLTAKQIAARLVLSQRTVENHVQNMLRKLRLTGRAALVRYAIENGLA